VRVPSTGTGRGTHIRTTLTHADVEQGRLLWHSRAHPRACGIDTLGGWLRSDWKRYPPMHCSRIFRSVVAAGEHGQLTLCRWDIGTLEEAGGIATARSRSRGRVERERAWSGTVQGGGAGVKDSASRGSLLAPSRRLAAGLRARDTSSSFSATSSMVTVPSCCFREPHPRNGHELRSERGGASKCPRNSRQRSHHRRASSSAQLRQHCEVECGMLSTGVRTGCRHCYCPGARACRGLGRRFGGSAPVQTRSRKSKWRGRISGDTREHSSWSRGFHLLSLADIEGGPCLNGA